MDCVRRHRIRVTLAVLSICSTILLAGCTNESLVQDDPLLTDGPAVEVAAGRRHSCALRADGTVVCWGKNQLAQLGDGTTEDSLARPRLVLGVEDASDISAGGDFSCAIVGGGQVLCWGFNASGQVGDGATLSIAAARTPVPGVDQAVDIATGADHTCAALADGTVRCWGANHSGQLGDDTGVDSVRPVVVEGLDDVESLSAGSGFTCALRRSGRASCWGLNSLGQLGDGGRKDRSTPVDVTGVDDLTAMDSHTAMTCAIRDDGSVWCWGADTSTRPDRTTGPRRIVGVDGATDIAVGEGTACAIADGRPYCWEGFGPAHEQRGHGPSVTGISVEGTSVCTVSSGGSLRCAAER